MRRDTVPGETGGRRGGQGEGVGKEAAWFVILCRTGRWKNGVRLYVRGWNMLNVNLYDKGIIDFYLGRPVEGERERERERK